MRFRDRIYRFMQGRYGIDQYSQFLSIAGLILIIISNFLGIVGLPINILGTVMFIYAYVRVFSKKINKRYSQNQKFLSRTEGIRNWFRVIKKRFKQRKTHKFFKCPNCKQKIRVPRGKGKIEITCPKCKTKFVRKS